MMLYAEDKMPLKWVFQRDNDPKHTSRKAKQQFSDNKIEVLKRPAQSPDLNPIENLWADIKRTVSDANPKNNSQLWGVVHTAWNSIPKKCYQG